MWVSTFHSACVRILRAEHEHAGLKSTFSIYDADDSRRLMQLVARELDLDPKRYPPRSLAAQVSNLKNELIDPEAVRRPGPTGPTSARVAEAYALYQRRLREAHALDFDDLIMTTVHLLQSHPAGRGGLPAPVPARAGRRVPGHQPRAVHADQGAGRRRTAIPPGELCVVGDADQSIYAFRGATIRNILEFERDYPDARTILLEQNYRSTQTILNAANAVIDRNTDRKPKRLWSDAGRRRADRRLRRRHRARRGRLGGPRDRPALRRRRRPAPATWRCSTAPTRSPACSRRCSSASACRTRSSAACASTSARRSATRWPTCGPSPTTTTR